MARLLGLRLGRIWINQAEGRGNTSVIWPNAKDWRRELLVLAAARACMIAFGIYTLGDQGGFGDEAQIQSILDEMFADEDDHERYIASLDIEAGKLLEKRNVPAAILVLADILTRESEIDGLRAERVIDGHLNTAFNDR